jgi:hypothetical protein
MAILNDEADADADAGGEFPRLRAETSLCTGLADTRPTAVASISAVVNGLRPTTPRGRRGFVLSGMLASCCSLLGRSINEDEKKKSSSGMVRPSEGQWSNKVRASKRWERVQPKLPDLIQQK